MLTDLITPRSAKDIVSLAATMMWSRMRMSISCSAATSGQDAVMRNRPPGLPV